MYSDVLVIGGGAAGLMAACGAARTLATAGSSASVTVLERMPRPARKIMITGKGRCNFTNVKDWNSFSSHIRTNPNIVRPAFYNFTPQDSLAFFEGLGMPTVVERGDRAYPASHHASDVIDALVRACTAAGVKIITGVEAKQIEYGVATKTGQGSFRVDGNYRSDRLIIATGGLSYPTTGSTGDGYRFAEAAGHSITPLFPSLTALVPKGYKQTVPALAADAPHGEIPLPSSGPHHLDRSLPLADLGKALCGQQLKNIGVQLLVEGTVAQEEFGDVDFTDGGLEGPVGFQISRKAVKSLLNGSRVAVVLDLKHGVPLSELEARIAELKAQIEHDPRSKRLNDKEKTRILLGKLMPWDLIPAFRQMNPSLGSAGHQGKARADSRGWSGADPAAIAAALKSWRFDIDGYVGYERAVVTAGGVDTSEVIAKTMESRKMPGLYFCGEVLDIDADTGGYNLHLAFATGKLAGESAAKALL